MNVKMGIKDSRSSSRAAQERESKLKIGNRLHCLICLLCLVTFALIVTAAGLTIHVLQIRQLNNSSEQNCTVLTSKLQSKISENSQLDFSHRMCLQNLSALSANLSDRNRTHSYLRHQFTEMETKYRSANETKAQICELLTCRREQKCSQGWIRNKSSCYLISTSNFPYNEAKQHCSDSDSKLLEINSPEEEDFVFKAIQGKGISFWIGKCECGKVSSKVLYQNTVGESKCGECTKIAMLKPCGQVRARFICENSAPLCPDIPEKIQDLCQQPMGPT